MKTLKLVLCLMMVAPLSMLAQSKGEMPFSGTPETNKLLRKSWAALADVHIEEGNNYARQVLQLDPQVGIAYASLFTEDTDELKENLRKAEQHTLSPDERMLVKGIMASLEEQSPRQYFDPLVKKYPKDHHLQLWIMFHLNDRDRSMEIGEAIIKRNPKFAAAYNLLGYFYMDKNDMARAEAHFNKYIALKPDLANPYDSKADYFMRIGKIEDAIPLYEKALAMGMKQSAQKAQRAKAMMKFPKPSEEDQSKIKQLIPSSIEAYEKGSVDQLVKDYSEHALKIWGNQIVTAGLPSVRRQLSNFFQSGTYTKFEGSVGAIQGTGPIAVTCGTIESVRKQSSTGTETTRQENVIYLLRKSKDGAWRILADHFYEGHPSEGVISAEDTHSIRRLIDTWDKSLTAGEVMTDEHLENTGALYSQQAIEIFGNETSNIGLANIRARWENFKGTEMKTNTLGVIGIEGIGRRAVAWGIANQSFYWKDSKSLLEFQFPWAMILTKEKDDNWRILVLHWGAD